jgi:hypothetical protein
MNRPVTDKATPPTTRKKVHALLLGDRIDTAGLERTDVLSTTPLAFRAGQDGIVTVFRYGVVVLFGMSLLEEDEVLRGLRSRIIRPVELREDETATVEITADKDEQILPGGPILLKAITPEHMIVIADALAKSVVLARDEREVSSVIEVIEPFARELAEKDGPADGAQFSSTLAMRCSCSIACRGASLWRKSRMLCGIAPTWSGFMQGCRTNMSSKSAPRRCPASSQ